MTRTDWTDREGGGTLASELVFLSSADAHSLHGAAIPVYGS